MILDQLKLDGRTALVTGCRRGIGLALAEGLAEAGADVIGVSASMADRGEEIESRVRAAGRDFTPYRCELSKRDSVKELVHRLEREGRRIDILVNNAGTTARKPTVEQTDEDWDRVLEVNLNAPFILSREIGKQMLARGRGKIIFTASLMAFQGGFLIPGYAASKGGIAQLTKALANEWAARGINVNAIAPGYIETDITAPVKADPVRGPSIMARIPAGRWGRPEDLKGAVVFLASAASDYLHGTILTVDGGWMGR